MPMNILMGHVQDITTPSKIDLIEMSRKTSSSLLLMIMPGSDIVTQPNLSTEIKPLKVNLAIH